MNGTNKCPICGMYELEEYEICPKCNWENDPVALYNPQIRGANKMTIAEAREEWQKRESSMPNFDYERRICPVCGKHVLDFFDICDECNWENDPVQFDRPDYGGGANVMSLNEARETYREGRKVE